MTLTENQIFASQDNDICRCPLIVEAMQAKGLSVEDARARICMFDINGLLA
jgi:hypothetical protein